MGLECELNVLKDISIMNEPVNWVKNRLECTIENKLWGPLLRQLRLDVKEVGGDFELVEGGEELVIRLKNKHRKCTIFRLTGDKVHVTPYKGTPFIVFEHWYDNEAQCGLLLKSDEEEPLDVELWQISQRALAGLFFDG